MKPSVPTRILVLVAATVALATAMTITSFGRAPDAGFWFWLAACFLGELLWVRLPVGQATVSMASCFHFAALLLLPRGQAMAVAALSGAIAESIVMRKPPLRAAFNAGQSALAVGIASAALQVVGPARAVNELVYGAHLLPLLAAAAAYFVVNTGAVSLAVAVSERISFARAWRSNFGGRQELISNGALFSLGALLASHYAMNGMRGTLLIALPLVVAYEAYRRSVRDRSAEPNATERRAA